MKYTVTGTVPTDEGREAWAAKKHVSGEVYLGEPFTETVTAAGKAEARWAVRRSQAPGKALAKLEKLPPNPEREAVEVNAPSTPEAAAQEGWVWDPRYERTKIRSANEDAEYERLVASVHIDSVVEHARGGTGGAK